MTETDKAAGTVYEVGFHVVPTVSPENLPKEVDAIKAALEKAGATVISEEFPKLRPLAYQMIKAIGPARHRFDTAYFGWIKFEGPKDSVSEIDKTIKANDNILRYIIVKTVRENTLYGAKILAEEKKEARDGEREGEKAAETKAAGSSDAAKAQASSEDIDKSIDKLVG